jgi:probable rRNA maturation factor
MPDTSPTICLYDHQSNHLIDLQALEKIAHTALPLCLTHPGHHAPQLLASCEEIEISLVDDTTIATVHGNFMNDPTATDVITFHHGEILISADTAARIAPDHQHTLERELTLYLIHGLLHLHGHDDLHEEARALMHTTQAAILDQIWPR